MTGQLQRAALITGASSGIGLAIARVLGAEGYALTLTARSSPRLDGAADRLAREGHHVTTAPADLSANDMEAQIRQVVAAHRERWGRMDVLVNSAGVSLRHPIADCPTADIDRQLGVNVRSLILVVREALPQLRSSAADHRNGLVVNVASIAGKTGFAMLGGYSATKHAVVGFTKSMNRELASSGIKAVSICPGYVDTPMTEIYHDDISPDQMIPPSDIAETVRFLLRLSPRCVVPDIDLQPTVYFHTPEKRADLAVADRT